MSENTKISWTDSTANFWSGCTKVSAGCANRYAETLSNRFPAVSMEDPDGDTMLPRLFGAWGKGKPRIKHKSAVKDCLRWNKQPWACECGLFFTEEAARECRYTCASDGHDGFPVAMHRRRVFSLSLGDWLDPEVPVEWLAEMLNTIRRCDQLRFILCTKRPELWRERIKAAADHTSSPMLAEPVGQWLYDWLCGVAPHNITLLTSVENQAAADLRIPELLKIPAVCRGLSLEPLLGPVDVEKWLPGGPVAHDEGSSSAAIDRLVIGGESGLHARPCNVEWIRSLVKQGQEAGVAVHVKQLGSLAVDIVPESYSQKVVGRFQTKHPKGGDPDEWPADLRVREWPKELSQIKFYEAKD